MVNWVGNDLAYTHGCYYWINDYYKEELSQGHHGRFVKRERLEEFESEEVLNEDSLEMMMTGNRGGFRGFGRRRRKKAISQEAAAILFDNFMEGDKWKAADKKK